MSKFPLADRRASIIEAIARQCHGGHVPLSLSCSAGDAAERLCSALLGHVRNLTAGDYLVTGPAGAGKSAAVSWALQRLASSARSGSFVVASLSGLLCGHDAGHAFAALSDQLRASVASPPVKSGGDSEQLARLLEHIKKRLRLSVVVVLDQLEQFLLAKSNAVDSRQKQIFVYCLLELVRPSTSLVVVGVSRHGRILDFFEKRVRSRLSQVQFPVYHFSSIDQLADALKTRLQIHLDRQSFSHSQSSSEPTATSWSEQWNEHVDVLIASAAWQRLLARHWQHSQAFPHYVRLVQRLLSIAWCSPDDDPLAIAHWTDASAKLLADSLSLLVSNLSALQLVLIKAALSVLDRQERGQPVNFLMIYAEFVSLRKRAALGADRKSLSMFPEVAMPTAHKSFEELVQLRLFVLDDPRSAVTVARDFRMYHLLLDRSDFDAVVRSVPDLPTILALRW